TRRVAPSSVAAGIATSNSRSFSTVPSPPQTSQRTSTIFPTPLQVGHFLLRLKKPCCTLISPRPLQAPQAFIPAAPPLAPDPPQASQSTRAGNLMVFFTPSAASSNDSSSV